MTVKLDPPYDRAPFGGSGSLVAAHAAPLGMATAEGWLVGVQLDLETRQAKDPKRPARHLTLYMERSVALDLAQAILSAVPRTDLDYSG